MHVVPIRPEDRRRCEACGESKTIDNFNGFRNGRNATCKECKRAANAAYMRKRREADPSVTRRMNLWRLYRIREDEYDRMRATQDGRCAACGVVESDIDISKIGGRRKADGTRSQAFPLQVDHCHSSGVIRGLLCPQCNWTIGMAKENPAVLRGAAAYLERTAGGAVKSDTGSTRLT